MAIKNSAFGKSKLFKISFVPLGEDLCVLSGKKINPLTTKDRKARRCPICTGTDFS